MADRTYSVLIDSNEYNLEVTMENGVLNVTNLETKETFSLNIDSLSPHLQQGSINDQSIIFGSDREGDTRTVVLNGIRYEADVVEKRFRERERKRKKKGGSGNVYPIEASIPGQVVEISVTEGDKVEEGQTLLLLSAMKLENEVQTPRAGTVSKINIETGANVAKGDTLMEIKG